MKLLKNEAGLAMPLVLMVMIVLAFLGTALWQYSISELNLSVRSEKIARAHYLARAGAETVALDLMWNPEKLKGLDLDSGESIISEDNINLQLDGTLKVEVTKNNDYEIDITGTGTVDGVSQTVTLRIAALEPFDGVMYASSSIEFNNSIINKSNKLTGDIISGESIYDHQGNLLTVHPDLNSNITHNKKMVFPEWDIPVRSGTSAGNLIAGENTVLNSDSMPSYTYDKVEINNHKKLTIEPTASGLIIYAENLLMQNQGALVLITKEGKDLEIVVENDLVLREVIVCGTGRAIIYVRSGEVNVYTKHGAIIDEGAHLLLILGEGTEMIMQSNSFFQGMIYGPGATVKMQGNTSFTGSMIVQKVQGMQNAQMQADEVHHKYSWHMLDELFGRFRMVQWIR